MQDILPFQAPKALFTTTHINEDTSINDIASSKDFPFVHFKNWILTLNGA